MKLFLLTLCTIVYLSLSAQNNVIGYINPNGSINTNTFNVTYNASFSADDYLSLDSVVLVISELSSRSGITYNQNVQSYTFSPLNCDVSIIKKELDAHGNTILNVSMKNLTSANFGFDIVYTLQNEVNFNVQEICPFSITDIAAMDNSITQFLGETDVIKPEYAAIVKIGEGISANCNTIAEVVENLVKWNRANLSYDYEALNDRESFPQDAISVLARKKGVCYGYSNLSCSILRSIGIPARSVSGQDILTQEQSIVSPYNTSYLSDATVGAHSWIEVYYPSLDAWVPTEPQMFANFIGAQYVSENTESGLGFGLMTYPYVPLQKYSYRFASETSETLTSSLVEIDSYEPHNNNLITNAVAAVKFEEKYGCNPTLAVPEKPKEITGDFNVCVGQATADFSVNAVPNADSYIWIAPDGTETEQTSNSFSCNIPQVKGEYSVSVKAKNANGVGEVISLPIWVIGVPAVDTVIVPKTVCVGQDVELKYESDAHFSAIQFLSNASYKGSDKSIQTYYYTITPNTVSGEILVQAQNMCGYSPVTRVSIGVVNKTPVPVVAEDYIFMCFNETQIPQFSVLNSLGTVSWDGLAGNDTYSPSIPTAGSTTNIYVTQTQSGCEMSDAVELTLTVGETIQVPVLAEVNSEIILETTYTFDWYVNDLLDVNSTTNTYSSENAASVYAVLTDDNNCKEKTNTINYTPEQDNPLETKIASQELNVQISKDLNNVYVKGLEQDATIEVLNVIGKSLETYKTTNTEFSCSLQGKPKGVYFIVVKTSGKEFVKKIMN